VLLFHTSVTFWATWAAVERYKMDRSNEIRSYCQERNGL